VIDSIGEQVLPQWLPGFMLPYLEYAVVTATKTAATVGEVPAEKRLKVAIIGSGLAGLTAAHKLTKEMHDVTIFESRPKAGLSGNSTPVHGKVVDIPLRMIGQGYYNHVQALADSVGVRNVPARADCTFYGDDGKGGTEMFRYAKSRLANLWSCIPYLSAGAKFNKRVLDSATDSETDTFGDWMAKHGYTATGGTMKGHEMTMWLMMGQMSWVLSCSYEQIMGYPVSSLSSHTPSILPSSCTSF
jgi:predicted NAD/FAD-binding protein